MSTSISSTSSTRNGSRPPRHADRFPQCPGVEKRSVLEAKDRRRTCMAPPDIARLDDESSGENDDKSLADRWWLSLDSQSSRLVDTRSDQRFRSVRYGGVRRIGHDQRGLLVCDSLRRVNDVGRLEPWGGRQQRENENRRGVQLRQHGQEKLVNEHTPITAAADSGSSETPTAELWRQAPITSHGNRSARNARSV